MMKGRLKRVLALVLTLCMLMSMVTIPAAAEVTENDIELSFGEFTWVDEYEFYSIDVMATTADSVETFNFGAGQIFVNFDNEKMKFVDAIEGDIPEVASGVKKYPITLNYTAVDEANTTGTVVLAFSQTKGVNHVITENPAKLATVYFSLLPAAEPDTTAEFTFKPGKDANGTQLETKVRYFDAEGEDGKKGYTVGDTATKEVTFTSGKYTLNSVALSNAEGEPVSSIEVDGKNPVTVKASALSINEVDLNEKVTWSVTDADDKALTEEQVTIVSNAITFNEKLAEGTYKVVATANDAGCNEGTKFAELKVTRTPEKLDSFEFNSELTMQVPVYAGEDTPAAELDLLDQMKNALDQFGGEVTGLAAEDFEWEITTGKIAGVTLDENAVLSVAYNVAIEQNTEEDTETTVTVKATYKENEEVSATADVTVTKAKSKAKTIVVKRGDEELTAVEGVISETIIVPTSDKKEIAYSAQVFDQYNAPMTAEATWTTVNKEKFVFAENGTLTVTAGAEQTEKDAPHNVTVSCGGLTVALELHVRNIEFSDIKVTVADKVVYGMQWNEIITGVSGVAMLDGNVVEGSFSLKTTGMPTATAEDAQGEYYEIYFEGSGYNVCAATGYVTVSPKPITINMANAEKVYGAEVPETFEWALAEGFAWVGEDVPNVTGSTTATAADEVGEYEISANVSGADNYAVTVTPGTLTITKKPLEVTAGTLVVSKVYDGTNDAGTVESGALVLEGVLDADKDNVSIKYTTIGKYAENDVNVGENKAITISGLELDGNKAGNYSISATSQQITSGKITKATLTAEMLTFTPASAVYDGTAKTVTVALNEPYTGNGEFTVMYNGAESAINADTYAITVTMAEGSNFEAAESVLSLGDFVITPKSIAGVVVKGLAENGYEYTGSEIIPGIIVKDGETELNENDYTVTYSDNVNYGTGKITITGKGNYTGTKEVTFQITRKHPSAANFTVTGLGEKTYNGSEYSVSVAYNGETEENIGAVVPKYYLVDGENVTEVSAPKNAGTYVVKLDVAGGKNYEKMLVELPEDANTLVIAQKNISSDVTVADIAAVTYDGSAKTPALTVTYGSNTLVKDTDYTVEYSANTDVGTATATLTGIGNYTGTLTKNFTITAKAFDSADITVTAADVTYNGEAQEVAPVVKDGNTVLTKDTDYTVAYSGDTTNVGTVTITVTGKGNYSDATQTATYKINPKSIAGYDVTVAAGPHTYTGSEIEPVVTIEGLGNTNYDVAYSNHVNAGTATITITGKGNYTGTKTVEFSIAQKEITSLTWTPANNGSVYYNRQPQNVTATAVDAVEGDEVEVTVVGGKQTAVGTYTAKATGLTGEDAANYKLTATNTEITYNIVAALDAVTVEYDGAACATVTAVIDTESLTVKLVGYCTDLSKLTLNDAAVGENLTANGGVVYKVINEVVALPAKAEVKETGATTVTGLNNIDSDKQSEVRNALISTNTTVDGMESAAVSQVTKEAESAPAGVAKVEVTFSLNIEPVAYDGATTLKLDIQPQVTVTYKAENDSPIGEATTKDVPNSEIKAPVTVSVKLPSAMGTALDLATAGTIFAKHTMSNGKFEYLSVTWDTANDVASWEQSSFSEVELVIDNRAANNVEFKFANETTQTVTKYTAANVGDALPTDSQPGMVFSGWEFTANGSEVEGTYTTLTDELLTALDGNTVTAAPVFTAASSGGSGRPGGIAPSLTLPYKTASASTSKGGSISPSGVVKLEKGESVTFTFTPDAGYHVKDVLVNGKSVGARSSYTIEGADESYTIKVIFEKNVASAMPFVDVAPDAYYYDAVLWALEEGITGGKTATTFAPKEACTRGQMVTFLWRAAGCPEPTTTVNPFVDVNASKYYYKAVLWALEEGITGGKTATTFDPNAACTRGQMATFLWRAAGQPTVSGMNAFNDVKAGKYYYEAVLWAAESGITNGKTAATFVPNEACNRGQMVTFLYRNEMAD